MNSLSLVSSAVSISSLGFWSGNVTVAQQDNTVTRLIAAMPPEAKSIIIVNYQLLRETETSAKIGIQTPANPVSKDADNLMATVLRAVAAAEPLIHVQGGSDFTPPPEHRTGVGDYVLRSLWRVRKPLTNLRRHLDAQHAGRQGVFRTSTDAHELYKGQQLRLVSPELPPVEKPVLVALIDDRTVAIAESRADLEHMIKSLASNPSPDLKNWSGITKHARLLAPVVVLRRYDPVATRDLSSPFRFGCLSREQISIETVAIWLKVRPEPIIELVTVPEDSGSYARFLKMWFFDDEDFAWIEKPAAGKTRVSIRIRSPELHKDLYLLMMRLFGVNVLI